MIGYFIITVGLLFVLLGIGVVMDPTLIVPIISTVLVLGGLLLLVFGFIIRRFGRKIGGMKDQMMSGVFFQKHK